MKHYSLSKHAVEKDFHGQSSGFKQDTVKSALSDYCIFSNTSAKIPFRKTGIS